MPILALAARSVYNRRSTALLTVLSIAVSVALLLGVERIRLEAQSSFANTISGTDLIVGARGGAINLLLYSVFRMGESTNNISWESYRAFAERKEVEWTIPLSLGDAHRGFRVVGTTADFFEHYRFARTRSLEFAAGESFVGTFDAVIGAEVAAELGYSVGQKVVIAHGLGATSFAQHDDLPFTISGVLRRTGTPVDRTVHVRLEGIEAIHVGWQSGTRRQRAPLPEGDIEKLEPRAITAFLVGLKSRLSTFQLQREINEYPEEALMAIIPGVALQQLWSLLGVVEVALRTISAFVVLAGLLGMLIAILTSLNERRREMAILRSIGARPWHVFALLVSEAGFLAAGGALLGLLIVDGAVLAAGAAIEERFGVVMSVGLPSLYDLGIMGMVVLAALGMGVVPAWRAYRNSLADGMTVRV